MAFWKGIGPAWLREASYTSLRLGLYAPIKHVLGTYIRYATLFFLLIYLSILHSFFFPIIFLNSTILIILFVEIQIFAVNFFVIFYFFAFFFNSLVHCFLLFSLR